MPAASRAEGRLLEQSAAQAATAMQERWQAVAATRMRMPQGACSSSGTHSRRAKLSSGSPLPLGPRSFGTFDKTHSRSQWPSWLGWADQSQTAQAASREAGRVRARRPRQAARRAAGPDTGPAAVAQFRPAVHARIPLQHAHANPQGGSSQIPYALVPVAHPPATACGRHGPQQRALPPRGWADFF